MLLEQGLQAQRVVGQAVLVFQVAVVKRQRVVGQIDQGDVAAGGAGRVYGDLNEFAVPGVATNAAGKSENLGHGRSSVRKK